MSAVIDELAAQVRRYPPERYPVQHATAQYHLGLALVDAGRAAEAEPALRTAVVLFEGRLALEHAKSLNALGTALRYASRPEDAASAFAAAARRFAGEGAATEEAAARYNLGLVQREAGLLDEALASFGEARAQVPAAERELGATLLQAGDFAAAEDALATALAHAERDGDTAGAGAAANTLGLALLAAGRTGEAVDGLRRALAAHPRTVRPVEHAMVKANLALAFERVADPPRARLAAHQALAIPEAAEPVVVQAREVLARLGDDPTDLLVVLDTTPRAGWTAVVREDLPRWGAREAEAWVAGLLARPASIVDLAEAWLDALLELPGDELERLVALVRETEDERFRGAVSNAMARFHVPQLERLKATFAWT